MNMSGKSLAIAYRAIAQFLVGIKMSMGTLDFNNKRLTFCMKKIKIEVGIFFFLYK
jgi:hypothetical protein